MPAYRFFVPQLFTPGQELLLQGSELHHLSHVMRRRSGAAVELVNGLGQLGEALLLKTTPKYASLCLKEVHTREPPLPPLHLFQALLALPLLDWMIEKGTELGVARFFLFPSDKSAIRAIPPGRHKRLETIAIQALKQCGRLTLPQIHFSPFPPSATLPLFMADLEAPYLSTYLNAPPLPHPYALLVGPEQGWSQAERDYWKERATPVKLHPYILRAETAATAGLALLAHYLWKEDLPSEKTPSPHS